MPSRGDSAMLHTVVARLGLERASCDMQLSSISDTSQVFVILFWCKRQWPVPQQSHVQKHISILPVLFGRRSTTSTSISRTVLGHLFYN